MAGRAIFESPNKLSNFIVAEQWTDLRYCRINCEVKVGLTGGGVIKVGEVVYRDNTVAGSEFVRCEAGVALPANIVAVIIVDDRVGDHKFFNHRVGGGFGTNPAKMGAVNPDWSESSTETLSLSCLYRGDAILRSAGLTFGTYGAGDSAKEATLINNLVSRDIRTINNMQGLFHEIPPYNL